MTDAEMWMHIDKLRSTASQVTMWCGIIALHQEDGIGKDRLNKLTQGIMDAENAAALQIVELGISSSRMRSASTFWVQSLISSMEQRSCWTSSSAGYRRISPTLAVLSAARCRGYRISSAVVTPTQTERFLRLPLAMPSAAARPTTQTPSRRPLTRISMSRSATRPALQAMRSRTAASRGRRQSPLR